MKCCRVGKKLAEGRCRTGNAPLQKEGPEGSGITLKFNRFVHKLGTKLWGILVKFLDGGTGKNSQKHQGSLNKDLPDLEDWNMEHICSVYIFIYIYIKT